MKHLVVNLPNIIAQFGKRGKDEVVHFLDTGVIIRKNAHRRNTYELNIKNTAGTQKRTWV